MLPSSESLPSSRVMPARNSGLLRHAQEARIRSRWVGQRQMKLSQTSLIGYNQLWKTFVFFVAPSGAQWCNGLVESNFREVKVVLRKLTAHFGANNVVFKSSFELTRFFTKACGYLNNRPIFFNDDAYIPVKSLVCPGFNTDNLDQILADTDSAFKTFLEHFDQLIITGNFQKFGGHSATKTCNLQKGDFVLVIFESQKKRCYGIVQNTPEKSKHNVDVKILRRRNADDNSDFLPKIESFSTRQIKLIHREK